MSAPRRKSIISVLNKEKISKAQQHAVAKNSLEFIVDVEQCFCIANYTKLVPPKTDAFITMKVAPYEGSWDC